MLTYGGPTALQTSDVAAHLHACRRPLHSAVAALGTDALTTDPLCLSPLPTMLGPSLHAGPTPPLPLLEALHTTALLLRLFLNLRLR